MADYKRKIIKLVNSRKFQFVFILLLFLFFGENSSFKKSQESKFSRKMESCLIGFRAIESKNVVQYSSKLSTQFCENLVNNNFEKNNPKIYRDFRISPSLGNRRLCLEAAKFYIFHTNQDSVLFKKVQLNINELLEICSVIKPDLKESDFFQNGKNIDVI